MLDKGSLSQNKMKFELQSNLLSRFNSISPMLLLSFHRLCAVASFP